MYVGIYEIAERACCNQYNKHPVQYEGDLYVNMRRKTSQIT